MNTNTNFHESDDVYTELQVQITVGGSESIQTTITRKEYTQ